MCAYKPTHFQSTLDDSDEDMDFPGSAAACINRNVTAMKREKMKRASPSTDDINRGSTRNSAWLRTSKEWNPRSSARQSMRNGYETYDNAARRKSPWAFCTRCFQSNTNDDGSPYRQSEYGSEYRVSKMQAQGRATLARDTISARAPSKRYSNQPENNRMSRSRPGNLRQSRQLDSNPRGGREQYEKPIKPPRRSTSEQENNQRIYFGRNKHADFDEDEYIRRSKSAQPIRRAKSQTTGYPGEERGYPSSYSRTSRGPYGGGGHGGGSYSVNDYETRQSFDPHRPDNR